MHPVTLIRNYTKHAEDSVLVESGGIKVLRIVFIEESVPCFLKGQNQGQVAVEYDILLRSTHTCNAREAVEDKQSGHIMEIQRLVTHAFRTAVDLEAPGESTITLDRDVLQADGGTRIAPVMGARAALTDMLQKLVENGKLRTDPMEGMAAAVPVGITNGGAICDLEYAEDSAAEIDMDVMMTEDGRIAEIQGTVEGEPFIHEELFTSLALAREGVEPIVAVQKTALVD